MKSIGAIIMAGVAFLVGLFFTPAPRETNARQVSICASVKLPAEGTCTVQTVKGYRVKICK